MRARGSSAFLSLAALTLLSAALLYAAAALLGAAGSGPLTTEAYRLSLSPGFTAEGIIIRSELPCSLLPADEGLRLSAGELSVPAAGLYFRGGDGLEYLSPADLNSADAQTVARLLASAPNAVPEARILAGKDWYFAALCPEGAGLTPGTSLRADFGRGELCCRVHAAGEGFIVLCMDSFLPAHASLRRCRAEIKTETLSGIAFAPEALRTDSSGSFVWALTAGRLEKKTVNILFTAGDFLLAEEEARPDALRHGDILVIGGTELYEGKTLT